MARCQVVWSTPGGGPAAGPGGAGMPCSVKQCAKPPWPVGATEGEDCSGGGVFDEHAARTPTATITAASDTAKLNFLLHKAQLESTSPIPVGALMALLAFFAVFMLEVPQRIIRFALPSNVFLFGAQKARYDKRRSMLGKVLWVVLIGGAVSVLATIIAGHVHWPWQ